MRSRFRQIRMPATATYKGATSNKYKSVRTQAPTNAPQRMSRSGDSRFHAIHSSVVVKTTSGTAKFKLEMVTIRRMNPGIRKIRRPPERPSSQRRPRVWRLSRAKSAIEAIRRRRPKYLSKIALV